MQALNGLKKLEILAARKATVYGRTLTDVRLARQMQDLAGLHGRRAQTLSALLGEECRAEIEEEKDET
jgi:hypothetical protein